MKRHQPYIQAAEELGAEAVEVDRSRGPHPKLIGLYKGVPFRRAFPGSASDHRSVLNFRCELKALFREIEKT